VWLNPHPHLEPRF